MIRPKLRLQWPWLFTVDVPIPGGEVPGARVFVTALTPWSARRNARRYLAEHARIKPAEGCDHGR